MKDVADLLGRAMISFIFFFEAYDSLWFITETKKMMTSYGLTWRQDMLLWGSSSVLILGATLVLLGYRSGFGALLLILYYLPLTFFAHPFWHSIDHYHYRNDSLHFMKNIAIIGGLLIILVNGSGRFSVKRFLSTTRVR